jgi:hypothetical protein
VFLPALHVALAINAWLTRLLGLMYASYLRSSLAKQQQPDFYYFEYGTAVEMWGLERI